ncbi:MAG: NAD(P)/FAD-dependent oxidoreductase, partial [Desulfuromusa sp.]|nr:NAD(P)/FAD-dependent oxidoreductase [Desulfuromusa sp.]
PDPFEVYHFPGFTVEQPNGGKNYIRELKARFPLETGIDDYFKDLKRARTWGNIFFASKVLPGSLAWLPRLIARLFLGKYQDRKFIDSLNDHLHSDKIKAVLTGQCGDYGLSPSRASLFIHATIFYHYEMGAHRPREGAQAVVEAIVSHLRDLDADFAISHCVQEILIKKGKVHGVRLAPVGREGTHEPDFMIRADRVVSAVGARNTYLQLINPMPVTRELCATLHSFPAGTSLLVAYLGLNEDPANLGFTGENHWFYRSTDLEQLDHMLTQPEENGAPIVYASFDKQQDADGKTIHTATLIASARYQVFLDCGEKGTWKKRSPAYEKLKAEQGQKLVDLVEREVPGFNDLIDTKEFSTPLSIEWFSLHSEGEAYGLPAIPERYHIHALGPRTPIKGLTLAGADSFAHGVVGAMVGGMTAFTSSLGFFGVIRFFRGL